MVRMAAPTRSIASSGDRQRGTGPCHAGGRADIVTRGAEMESEDTGTTSAANTTTRSHGAPEPSNQDLLAAARSYQTKRAWRILPVNGKDPSLNGPGWQDLEIDPHDQPERFTREGVTGIAVHLGPSGLADLEADCLAAEYVLDELAPATDCSWEHGGRKHRGYGSDAEHRSWKGPPQPDASEKVTRVTLVEVRAGNHLSVVPPSRHADGKPYTLLADGEPGSCEPDALYRVAALAASAGVFAPIWPSGARQDATLALAGYFRRANVSEMEAAAVIGAICRVSGDEEDSKRRAAVADTYCRPLDRATTGLPTIAEIFGAPVAEWLAREFPSATSSDEEAPSIVQWPDPIAEEAFHGIAGEIVRTIKPHTEADPVALLLQLLVAFGSVIGRNAYFLAEASRHHTNLFVALVGATSKARKGSSWSQVRRLFHAIDPTWAREHVEFGLSTGEGLIWAVRDPIEKREPIKEKGRVVDYQFVTTDPGVEDKRLLVIEEEFASPLRVMGREGSTLSPVIRTGWDHGDLRTLTKNSPARATGAHISIIGHITRGELLRDLDDTQALNGFGNRFLWICVRRSNCLPDGGSLQDESLWPLTERLGKCVEFARKVERICRDEEARAMWYAVYPELSEGKPGLLGSMIARAEAQVMRLATVYALLDQSAVIRREHLNAALAIWEYAEASARFIFGDSLGNPVADGILKALRQAPDGLTRTEMSSLFHRNKSAAQISLALATLAENGLARREKRETEGRVEERWFAMTLATKETKETN